MMAHVGGVPLEEALPALAGTSTGLLVVRAWVMLRVGRRREPGT
jgi:hypothetical protein